MFFLNIHMSFMGLHCSFICLSIFFHIDVIVLKQKHSCAICLWLFHVLSITLALFQHCQMRLFWWKHWRTSPFDPQDFLVTSSEQRFFPLMYFYCWNDWNVPYTLRCGSAFLPMLIPRENSEAGRCDNNSARHPKSQNREKRCPVSCNLVMSSVESCRVICRLTMTSHVVSRCITSHDSVEGSGGSFWHLRWSCSYARSLGATGGCDSNAVVTLALVTLSGAMLALCHMAKPMSWSVLETQIVIQSILFQPLSEYVCLFDKRHCRKDAISMKLITMAQTKLKPCHYRLFQRGARLRMQTGDIVERWLSDIGQLQLRIGHCLVDARCGGFWSDFEYGGCGPWDVMGWIQMATMAFVQVVSDFGRFWALNLLNVATRIANPCDVTWALAFQLQADSISDDSIQVMGGSPLQLVAAARLSESPGISCAITWGIQVIQVTIRDMEGRVRWVHGEHTGWLSRLSRLNWVECNLQQGKAKSNCVKQNPWQHLQHLTTFLQRASFLYRFCIDFAMVAEVVIHGAAAALRQSGAGPMDVQAQRAQRHRFGGLLTSHDWVMTATIFIKFPL